MLISIGLVEPGRRLRGLNKDQVAALADSIAEVGLLSPIAVYARDVIRANVATPGYGLVAGLHRLEACRSLGLADVEAVVVEIDELDRQIAECDENLCGTKLTPAERAMFTARRKDAYEAKHPETRHGGVGRGGKKDDSLSSFSEDTARRTGVDQRSVQRDAARGDRITDDALAEIRGTDIDKGVYLDEVAATPRDGQAAKVQELKRRVEDRKLVQGLGDQAVQRDASDDAAQMLIDFIPEGRMQQLLSYLDGAGATRVTKAVRRALKVDERVGSDRAVFDQTMAGAA